MSTVRNHRDLDAWRVAMNLAMESYRLSELFPAKETYGLQSQLRRAAVSVPSNIAEGQSRPVRAALNHLSIAIGSLAEMDTQVEIALRLNYLSTDAVNSFRALHESSRRLVYGLRRSKRSLLTAKLTQSAGLILMFVYTL